ncbi:hypothetical protein C0Q70_11049 [Pomacea canaliculata]|uniref:G-protein coupled receptors family 1 profile domain-containing protein n=1 Tax=Pomacea canaliculata TaxID=400727 RepID=A0A2T7P4W7_POMCA|nr:hypothetical protein C0Q70_11049 [Pomacea canaliculata]
MSTLPWSDTRSEGQGDVGSWTSMKSSTTPEGCLVLQLVDFVPWENPEDLVSADVENLVDRIKAAIVVPIVCIIGFPTNCLNMAVFYKLGLRERINTCLFILSFVDLLYLVFICLLYGERAFALSPSRPRYGLFYRFTIENHFQGLYGIGWASAFVTTVIGSERCFCIYFPLRSQTVIKTKTMAIFLTLSCLLITLGYYIVSEKYNMICLHDVERNVTFWQFTATAYYFQHQSLVDIFDNAVYGLCLPTVFIIIDISCTAAMFAKLKKTMSWRFQASSTISAKEAMLTKMLSVGLSKKKADHGLPVLCTHAN